MKKKVLVLFLSTSFAIGNIACGNKDTVSASEIIEQLNEASYPIGDTISYTEKNDPNKLLGRPKQYIEKVSFSDLRFEQNDENTPLGGSIEIFKNKKDCQSRLEYLQEAVQNSLLTEYDYQFDTVLLRLNQEMDSASADSYASAVEAIITGKEVVDFSFSPEDTSTITVFFDEGTSEDQIQKIGDIIEETCPDIIDIEYISADKAWEEFKEVYLDGSEVAAEGFKNDNPLSNSSNYEITVPNGITDNISSELEDIDGIKEIKVSMSNNNE